jgi:hypothetical protein
MRNRGHSYLYREIEDINIDTSKELVRLGDLTYKPRVSKPAWSN